MLYVWLRSQHSPLAVWHTDTKQWQAVDSWQQLQDIYGIHGKKSVCLYFPSSHLLQVTSGLSATQLKQLGSSGKQYLFEELSIAPADQLLVRQVGQGNTHHLYALAQTDIDAWQQSAQLAGLSVQAFLPDFLLLPSPIENEGADQQVTLYQDDQTMLIRQSEQQGLAVSYLPLILERLPQLTEIGKLPAIDLSIDNMMDTAAADPLAALADNATTNGMNDDMTAMLAARQITLTMMSATPTPVHTPERHALNFFTKTTDSQLSPYLRVAMMVALSALVLQMATDALQVYRYEQAATATQSAIAAQYESWFPNEPLSLRTKLQVQLQPKLRVDSQNASPHMAALAKISPLIKQSTLKAQALTIEPSALRFTLIAPDRGSLDQFASTLSAQGLSASLERVNSDDAGQFSGQISVNVATDSATQAAPAAS